MLLSAMRCCCSDFGVAMKLSDTKEDDMDVVGTPYWMAPEIIEMTGTTTACDVWSVGCTIIELLTGTRYSCGACTLCVQSC